MPIAKGVAEEIRPRIGWHFSASEPSEYFAEVTKALAPPVEVKDTGPTQAQIEETVLRTLRRLGWAPVDDDERKSGSPTR